MDTAKEEIITNVPVKKKKGIIFAVVVALLSLICGIITTIMLTRTQHVTTGNARVTTDLITLRSTTPGFLERFNLYEGREVREGEILGWIRYGESFQSPVNGIVIDTSVTIGQYILPMEVLATIADTSNIHIQANIYETDIQNVRLGQPAIVTIDTFGNKRLTGYVSNISRINQAELIGMPVALFVGGTFRRFTQTVPVRITITDDVNLSYVLGASARVSLPVTDEIREVATNNNVKNFILTTGIVESVQSRNVYGTLPYKIRRIYVEEGDRITAGQTLGALDTTDLIIQISAAEAQLQISEVAVAAAEHNHAIQNRLHTAGAVPLNDLRQAQFALQSAIASRQQAQAMLDSTRLALERSVIVSPMTGTVTAVVAREESSGMGLLFVVEDTDNLKITTGFREYDLSNIYEGMEVRITAYATDSEQHKGIITRISTRAISSFPVVIFEAEIGIVSNTSLRIGMTARIEVDLDPISCFAGGKP